jgi:hypothetical protein
VDVRPLSSAFASVPDLQVGCRKVDVPGAVWNIYVVILPQGVVVTSPDGSRSCNASGGLFSGCNYNFWEIRKRTATCARYA